MSQNMSRNARTRSQLLSVYYKIIPCHTHLLNVLPPMGIKILRLLCDSVMNNSLSTHYKHLQMAQKWLSILALFMLTSTSLRRHTNIWTSGWNWTTSWLSCTTYRINFKIAPIHLCSWRVESSKYARTKFQKTDLGFPNWVPSSGIVAISLSRLMCVI